MGGDTDWVASMFDIVRRKLQAYDPADERRLNFQIVDNMSNKEFDSDTIYLVWRQVRDVRPMA